MRLFLSTVRPQNRLLLCEREIFGKLLDIQLALSRSVCMRVFSRVHVFDKMRISLLSKSVTIWSRLIDCVTTLLRVQQHVHFTSVTVAIVSTDVIIPSV